MKNENQIADAILKAANLLGNGDAATPMGAIEALGAVHKESLSNLTDALWGISSSLNDVADAIREKG